MCWHQPLSGVRPFWTIVGKFMTDNSEQALAGQQITLGRANRWAACAVKGMQPSETKQVSGGMRPWDEEWLSLWRRSQKGWRKFFRIESKRAGTGWVTSSFSNGGSPSGMASKRKSGRPSRALAPLDLSNRL